MGIHFLTASRRRLIREQVIQNNRICVRCIDAVIGESTLACDGFRYMIPGGDSMSTLTTDRLVLRPFKEGDAGMMYRNWTSDEQVARYCHWSRHENLDATAWLLKMYLEEAASGFDFRWAITEKDSDEPIGAIDVVEISDNGKTAEIGYVLSRCYWGRGYMTEAFRAVIRELHDNGITKIKAVHHIDNPGSGRVMEKCGLRFVGTGKAIEKWGSDTLCDVCLYELVWS